MTDTILITGVSRGIGRSIALQAAARSMRVIGIARTQGAMEELHDEILKSGAPTPTMIAADIGAQDFEEKAHIIAQSLYERDGKCDYFVGNGGILGLLTPLHLLEPKDFMKIWRINVFANHILLKYLFGLLQQSSIGRVALMSSGAADSAPAFWGGYSSSKAALNTMSDTLKKEWVKSHMDIMHYNPGATSTQMRASAFPGEDPMQLPNSDEVATHFLNVLIDTPTLPANSQFTR